MKSFLALALFLNAGSAIQSTPVATPATTATPATGANTPSKGTPATGVVAGKMKQKAAIPAGPATPAGTPVVSASPAPAKLTGAPAAAAKPAGAPAAPAKPAAKPVAAPAKPEAKPVAPIKTHSMKKPVGDLKPSTAKGTKPATPVKIESAEDMFMQKFLLDDLKLKLTDKIDVAKGEAVCKALKYKTGLIDKNKAKFEKMSDKDLISHCQKIIENHNASIKK